MTDAVQISIVTGVTSVAMSVVAGYFAYRASKTSKLTHDAVNSRMDKFLEMAKKSFTAEGRLEGAEEQKRSTDVKING